MYPEYRKKISDARDEADEHREAACTPSGRRIRCLDDVRRLPRPSLPALALCAIVAVAVSAGGRSSTQNFDSVEIKVQPAQGNVYMLVGAGGNVTVQIGKDGVLVVDTQYAPLSNKILAAIRTLSQGPIRYIINTHVHADHVGGNENIRKAGSDDCRRQRVVRHSGRRAGRADHRARQRAASG